MSDKLDGLVNSTADLVTELSRLSLDWRVTAVPFGDLTVGERVVSDLPFVTTERDGHQLLRTLPRFGGGSNTGESSLDAMLSALGKPYRRDAVKIVVLLTDEPGLQSAQVTVQHVTDALRSAEVICFVASPNLPYFRKWATDNGGCWYPIAASMDTRALLEFLRKLVRDIPKIADKVHQLGGVRRYLELQSGDPA
jgi:hypothetical protein